METDLSKTTSVPDAPDSNGLEMKISTFSLSRKNYKLPDEDLDMVAPNLFIGSADAARNVDLLKKFNITHILTIENNPLDVHVQKHFVYKYKFLHDLPSSNILDILDECIEFIDNAVENSSRVLVHCLVGMSRSASIVIGYLMYKERRPFLETLEIVRKNRYVKPNTGFQRQLEFFENLDYQIVKDSSIFRAFKLEKMADMIQMGRRFEEIYIGNDTNNFTEEENIPCYKCKKCRFKLFNIKQIVEHFKDSDNRMDWKHKFEFYAKRNNMNGTDTICKEEIYIEPLEWFQSLLSDLSGKINCPKCDAKLGSFDWSGNKCPCGSWVTPAFHITKSKVDFCNFN